MRSILRATIYITTCHCIAGCSDRNDVQQIDVRQIEVLQEDVLKDLYAADDRSKRVSDAYRRLFTYVGISGAVKLSEDENMSIALQAAWETHKKIMKRSPIIRNRTEWVLDREPLEEFLKLLSKRLKSDPPAWWAATFLNCEVFPGKHHAFSIEGPLPPKAKVEIEEDHVVLSSRGHSIEVSRSDLDMERLDVRTGNLPVILCGSELSVVSVLRTEGYPFSITGIDSNTSKKLWSSKVWASRRGDYAGPLEVVPVEICRIEDLIIVYGYGSFGMYIEGFDAKTGSCRFRFCTCYWFNFSEEWGIEW